MPRRPAWPPLIYQFGPLRTNAQDAVSDLGSCRDLATARFRLQSIAQRRWQQADQVAALDVSDIPDGAELVAALRKAWIASALSDESYADVAANLESGCASGSMNVNPNYQEADTASRLASDAKTAAAQLWNARADALGQLPISASDL